MERNPQDFSDLEKQATFGCLRVVEQRKELLQGCLHGKETVEKPLLVAAIKEAQLRDAEMLVAIDEEITELKSQIDALELQAEEFRREIAGH